MKKAIVTGANGFVGRYLVKELTARGYEVWAIVRSEKANTVCLEPSSPHIVYCDLSDIAGLPAKLPPEADGSCFYHLAWSGSSGPAREDYELQLKNAAACANAAKAAKQIGCSRFVGAGSVTQLVYRDYLQRDGTRAEMIACYAIGKIVAEYLTRCICANIGIEYNWTYIANFYGEEDTTQNFINFLAMNYLAGKTPELTDGEQFTDFTYVSDVARGLLAVGEKGVPGSTYYIGYGQPRPLKEYVKTVRDCAAPALDSGLGRKEFLALPIRYNEIDVGKLHRDTGFVPLIGFQEGVQRTIEWLKMRRDNS